MDKKQHEDFVNEIEALNEKTDEQVLSEFNKIVKKSFEISGGNLNKLPLIIKRAKKLVMIKATSGALKTIREVKIKSREFAKVKIGSV